MIRLRAAIHFVTWMAASVVGITVPLIWLIDSTSAPAYVSRITPRMADGQHETWSALGNVSYLMFMLLAASVLFVMGVAAGGLRSERG